MPPSLRRWWVAGLWLLLVAAPPASGAEDAPLWQPRLPGASITDTVHYRIESDCDAARLGKVADLLERFHAFLSLRFAGRAAADGSRLTVRFFHQQADFQAYGQKYCANFSPNWGGYYHYGATVAERELVAFDRGENYTVLCHEGFHQFMHRTFKDIAAWPPWFNEGLADYVARGRLVDGAYALTGVIDPADLATVRDAVVARTQVPLADLLALPVREWNGANQQLDYAEGYLLAWYLMNTDEPRLQGLLSRFLVKLSETQDYSTAFAATIGAVGVPVIEHKWLAFVRSGR